MHDNPAFKLPPGRFSTFPSYNLACEPASCPSDLEYVDVVQVQPTGRSFNRLMIQATGRIAVL